MPLRSCLPEPTVALGDNLTMQWVASVPTCGACIAPAIVPRTFRTGTLTVIAPHSNRCITCQDENRRCCLSTDQRFMGPGFCERGPHCFCGVRQLVRL